MTLLNISKFFVVEVKALMIVDLAENFKGC